MRWVALLCLLVGCDAGTPDDEGDTERRISFLVPGTDDPLPEGGAVEIYLRPQGVYGAEVGLHVFGVAVDAMQEFHVVFTAASGHVLADQRFLPTSTAVVQGDGSYVMEALPIVFDDSVAESEVEDVPGTMTAEMMTSPPTTGELDIVLEKTD